jgi:hypothetical protein
VDASGLETHRLSANVVSGRLVGVSLDGSRLVEGGAPGDAFVDPAGHDYRPRLGSVLAGRADPSLIPPPDFDDALRQSPFDVGAYEIPEKKPSESGKRGA